MSPIRLLVGWGIFRLKKEVIIWGADPMKTTFVGRVTQKPNKTRAFEGCYEEPEISNMEVKYDGALRGTIHAAYFRFIFVIGS